MMLGYPEALERSFRRLRRGDAAGIDGMTVAKYEQNLQRRLQDLHAGRCRSGEFGYRRLMVDQGRLAFRRTRTESGQSSTPAVMLLS